MVIWKGGQLKLDPPMIAVDRNSLKVNECPMQPMFTAVKVAVDAQETPAGFKFQNFDNATTRHNLQALFHILDDKTVYLSGS